MVKYFVMYLYYSVFGKYYYLIMWIFIFKCLDSMVIVFLYSLFLDCNIVFINIKIGDMWE